MKAARFFQCLEIDTDRGTFRYSVHPLTPQVKNVRKAFRLVKLDPKKPEAHDIYLDHDGTVHCTCGAAAWRQRHDGHCKHARALLATGLFSKESK